MRQLDIANLKGKTNLSKGRIKVIIKYIELFEFLYACGVIEQRLISSLSGIPLRTIERYLSDIKKDVYGKDLIRETRDGRIIRIHLTSEFYTTIGSGDRLNLKRISKGKIKNALLRALEYKFYNNNSNREILDHLNSNNLTTEEYYSCTTVKNKYVWEEKKYDFIEAVKWTGLDNLSFDEDNIYIDSIFVCDGSNNNDIVKAYDKILTVIEYLKAIDYRGCRHKNVNIDFTVISLERVKIKDYIYTFQNTFREYDKNKNLHLFVNRNRGKREFFGYYRKTCPLGTKFFIYSKEIQDFIQYGNK